MFSGAYADYQIVSNGGGGWTVTDLRGGSPDGVDTLTNIELAQFSDQVITLGADPPPPVVPVPDVASITDDTGTPGDGITSDNVLVLSGTAEPNSTVTIYQDGSPLAPRSAPTAAATGATPPGSSPTGPTTSPPRPPTPMAPARNQTRLS